MTTTKDILIKAAEIVEQGWTQGELARTKEDNPCEATYPNACKFCMTGAILRAAGDAPDAYQVRLAINAATKAVRDKGYSTIPQFNDADDRKKGEVAATLREAAIHVR